MKINLRIVSLVALGSALHAAEPSSDKNVTSPDIFHLSAKTAFFDAFDTVRVGESPKHWRFDSVNATASPWVATAPSQTISPPRVLQSPGTSDPNGYAIAFPDGHNPLNGEVSFHVMPLKGATSMAVDLIWRWQSASDFYDLEIDSNEDRATLYRWRNGKRKEVSHRNVIFMPNKWHTVRVIFLFQSYTVYIDDELTLAGKDKAILSPGAVGLASHGDSVFAIDDFRLKE